MEISVIGYPRVGAHRELKSVEEGYFAKKRSREQLLATARELRLRHWRSQQAAGVDLIACNDFSFYDGMLDTAWMLGAVPERYRQLGLDDLDTYFAMARGYQGPAGDEKALAMRKWFNTNYHFLVPEVDRLPCLRAQGPLAALEEARGAGVAAKVVLIGPLTFLKLAKIDPRLDACALDAACAEAYGALLEQLAGAGARWVQIDEPILVTDLTEIDRARFSGLYRALLARKGAAQVLLQTYFGDIRDVYDAVMALPFDGVGLDCVEGEQTLALVRERGFDPKKILFAGVVSGKNIWRNDYAQSLEQLRQLQAAAPRLALSTSCSLLHVPYTLEGENGLAEEVRRQLAFAQEKLTELADLRALMAGGCACAQERLARNRTLIGQRRGGVSRGERIDPAAFTRQPARPERARIQRRRLGLPLLPTTTIGSFPQTADVKGSRARLRRGQIDPAAYEAFVQEKIARCIDRQQQLGLDVLVHGEYERNDMAAYFGEQLDGFAFTQNGWVQSYGTRCVRPPIIVWDIARKGPMTVREAVYAQSLTDRPVKGMLTGPVTILNWSFPREDVTHREMALQIALAIRQEVLDLEKAGIRVIQIDEAALKEKLPLRRSDWEGYLSWAIPAFRLTHSGAAPATQIHTHMCYSEFGEILEAIDAMDADVISFEASRSDLALVEQLGAARFETAVGPGVYDIHSPRVPDVAEFARTIEALLAYIAPEQLWINPDCGLKTRGERETWASLANMVAAAREARAQLAKA